VLWQERAVPIDNEHVRGISIVAWPLENGEPKPDWKPGTDTIADVRPGSEPTCAGHEPRTMRLFGRRRRPLSESPSCHDSTLACSVASIGKGTVPIAFHYFFYSIKKEGTPASFRLKTAQSTISR
jgi:hypothetical protein